MEEEVAAVAIMAVAGEARAGTGRAVAAVRLEAETVEGVVGAAVMIERRE